MAADMTTAGSFSSRFWQRMRWVIWGGAAGLLLLPLLAMRLSAEVDWTGMDFAVMAAMLVLACAAFEVAIRAARSDAYVVASGVAVAAAFLTAWVNLAVGIVGDPGHPANLMFYAVLAVGLAGMLIARLEPLAMARAMTVTAFAQALACAVALILDGWHVFALTCVFLAMWLLSAFLFRRAAHRGTVAGATR